MGGGFIERFVFSYAYFSDSDISLADTKVGLMTGEHFFHVASSVSYIPVGI